MTYVLVTGNPVDGLEFYGPFPDAESAHDWAAGVLKNAEWWIAPMSPWSMDD